MSRVASLILSPEEIEEISGGYTQKARQLQHLRDQGFHRARRSRVTGDVILERAHYDAVCASTGLQLAAAPAHTRPQLRKVHG